jgi:hypothetical protein
MYTAAYKVGYTCSTSLLIRGNVMGNAATSMQDATIESPSALMHIQLKKQRDSFLKEGFVSYEARISRLSRLSDLLFDNMDDLCNAMSEDFGHRSQHLSRIADFYATLESIKFNKKNLKNWMKD